MFDNVVKNRFWFFKALETYSLAVYFIVKRSTGIFDWDHSPLSALDDPPFIFALAVVGTIALVYALWDVRYLYYKQLMTGTLTFVWLVFFLSFCANDALLGVYLSFPWDLFVFCFSWNRGRNKMGVMLLERSSVDCGDFHTWFDYRGLYHRNSKRKKS